MSLISDALKEAQRERSVRAGVKEKVAGIGALGLFPAPARRKRQAPNRRYLALGVAVAGLAVLVLLLTNFRSKTSPPRSSPVRAPSTRTTLPAPVSKPQTAAPVARRAAASIDSIQANAPARPAVATRSALAHPTQTAVERVDGKASPGAAAADTAPSSQASTPRAAADQTKSNSPPVAPPAVPSTPLRIIVDPAGRQPADSLFRMAYAEHVRGALDRAQELYERAIAQPNAPAELFNDYGTLLAQRGDGVAAMAMFQQAVKRDSRNADAWINLGDGYNDIGHHAEAMSAYARVLQLDPSNVPVRLRLATEYQAINDTASARKLYQESLKLAPKNAELHYAYGTFLNAQHDVAGAVREFQAFLDAPGTYSPAVLEQVRAYVSDLRRKIR